MPKKTYTQINSVTLAVASSSVTLGSIPQNFRDLVLVSQAKLTTGTSAIRFRFNGDAGSNYPSVVMEGTELGSPVSSTTNTIGIRPSGRFSELTTSLNQYILQVMDYSATDKHKTALLRTNGLISTLAVVATAARWANTGAITSLNIAVSNGGSFASGTTFALYGIEA